MQPPAPVQQAAPAVDAEDQVANAQAMVDTAIKAYVANLSPEEKAAVADEIKVICGKKNYRTVTDLDALRALYQRFVTTE